MAVARHRAFGQLVQTDEQGWRGHDLAVDAVSKPEAEIRSNPNQRTEAVAGVA
jgi:hypothetical protein